MTNLHNRPELVLTRLRAALLRAALLAMLTALAFAAFFQASKLPVFDGVNPFAADPPDAVASIAFQVALAAGLLTLARAVRLVRVGAPALGRAPLILRGSGLVVLALAVTLAVDGAAELHNPGWGQGGWGALLIFGLATLAVLGALTTLALAAAARVASEVPPADPAGFLDEALADCLGLAWLPISWLGRRLPALQPVVQWAEGLAQRPFVRHLETALAWIHPRAHPWRLAALVGLAAGVALSAGHALEGLPPNLAQTAFVTLLFITIEWIAALGGFLLFGGLLGLRPPLSWPGRQP